MLIRDRTEDDLEPLGDVLRRVHERDRYPIHLPDGGFQSFLTHVRSEAAWVAVDQDDTILGHVALNAETTEAAMDLVDSVANGHEAIYISRLFVDTTHRSAGAGRLLLDHALTAAQQLGRFPALDVLDIPSAAPAIALYQRAGWTEVGRVSFELADAEITERVFVGPYATAG